MSFHLTILAGAVFLVFVGLTVFIVYAILKYIKSKDIRREKTVTTKSLGEAIKAHRTKCKMTQESVAETLGVTYQNRKTEHLTQEQAKLYGFSAEELLREIEK